MKLLKLCKQMRFSGVFLGFMAISLINPISYYMKIRKGKRIAYLRPPAFLSIISNFAFTLFMSLAS